MKCKRCLSYVPDDMDICPNCGQDLSSLRQLLKNFYEEQAKSQPERNVKPFLNQEVSPPIIPESSAKKVDLLSDGDAEDHTRGPNFTLSHALSADEPDEDKDEDFPHEDEEAEPLEEKKEELSEELGKRGGFWLRLLAFAVDCIVLAIILAVFGVFGLLAFKLGIGGKEEISILLQARILFFVLLPFGCALSLVYFTFFHGTWRQTLGKMIFGLRVVQTDGQPLSFPRSLGRAVAYILSAVPVFIGFFWVGFNSEKRSWHDVIANTMVVREG